MNYDRNNIFARILRGEVPCDKLYEDGYALAFRDAAPAAPEHALVLPKGEYVSFDDFAGKADAAAVAGFFSAVRKTAELLRLNESGYRLVANHGADASQSVPHFHVHILGGRPLGGLLPGDIRAR